MLPEQLNKWRILGKETYPVKLDFRILKVEGRDAFYYRFFATQVDETIVENDRLAWEIQIMTFENCRAFRRQKACTKLIIQPLAYVKFHPSVKEENVQYIDVREASYYIKPEPLKEDIRELGDEAVKQLIDRILDIHKLRFVNPKELFTSKKWNMDNKKLPVKKSPDKQD